jgi:hypothetical protein
MSQLLPIDEEWSRDRPTNNHRQDKTRPLPPWFNILKFLTRVNSRKIKGCVLGNIMMTIITTSTRLMLYIIYSSVKIFTPWITLMNTTLSRDTVPIPMVIVPSMI